MRKRGQAAFFIILGIIILITVILGLAFREDILDFLHEKQIIGTKVIPKEIEPVNEFILDCIQQTGEEALAFVGAYAGYYNTSRADKNERGVPYWFKSDRLIVPPKEFIASSLVGYINNNLKYCTNGFTEFNNSFAITEGKVSTKANVLSGKVNFYVKYPVVLKKESSEHTLKYFSVDVNNNLDKIYSVAVSIVNDQLNYDDICLSCLYNVSVTNDLRVEIYNPVLHEVEYTFVDDEVRILDNESYKFVVALRLL